MDSLNPKMKVLADGYSFLEAPRWHGGRLWMAEVGTQQVVTLSLNGERQVLVGVPGIPSGLGFLPDGSAIVVSLTQRRLMKVVGNTLEQYADLSTLSPFLNDMVIDRQGNAYVGDFGYNVLESGPQPALPGTLILVKADGTTRVVAEGLFGPNGCAITPDGRLVVAESFADRVSSFPIHPDGSLGQRSVDCETPGLPDGICVDVEGAVWVALAKGSRFDRMLNGKVVATIETPGRMAIACQLGGADGRTLFCVTSTPGVQADIGKNLSARVEVVTVAVPGAGSP